jgi:hypothetical protein
MPGTTVFTHFSRKTTNGNGRSGQFMPAGQAVVGSPKMPFGVTPQAGSLHALRPILAQPAIKQRPR